MSLAPIPAALQWPAVAVVAGLTLLSVLLLYLRHRERNATRRALSLPTKSTLQHLRTYPVFHATALLLLLVAGAIALGVGVGYALLHHGGGVREHLHIPPPVRPPRAGGAGIYVSPDLFAAAHMIPYIPDQDGTNSCCGWATVQIDQLNRALRYGEHVPYAVPQSGFKPWWYASGHQNVGTTIEDEVAALNAHGYEALSEWQANGYETPADAALSTLAPGAHNTYDYYEDAGGGRAGLNDVEWRLDHRTPMYLVWAVHQSSDATPPDGFTDDTGPGLFFHCAVATRWTSNYQGHGEAVQVWNWWNPRWGIGGFGWISARAFMANVKGASTETPGARIASWEPPPPPVPTALPTRSPTARPTPSRTPTPLPAYHGVYVSRGSNLRATPSPAGHVVIGLSAGTRLRSLGSVSGAWVKVQLLVRDVWHRGWCPLAAVVRSR